MHLYIYSKFNWKEKSDLYSRQCLSPSMIGNTRNFIETNEYNNMINKNAMYNNYASSPLHYTIIRS